MDYTKLSIEARATLEKAGWTPDRKVDTAVYEATWQERNLPRHQCVVDFLASFGALQVKWPWAESFRDFDFDALEAADAYHPEALTSWNEMLQDSLVPIGYISGGPQLVLMSSKGAFWGSFTDSSLNELGETTKEFLEMVCSR